MGGFALIRTGDRVRIDLAKGSANMLIFKDLAERRRGRRALTGAGGYAYPRSQTPWQEIQRATVGQMETGSVREGAGKY